MYSKSANSVHSITSDHFDVKSFLPGIARYTRKKAELCVKVDGQTIKLMLTFFVVKVSLETDLKCNKFRYFLIFDPFLMVNLIAVVLDHNVELSVQILHIYKYSNFDSFLGHYST